MADRLPEPEIRAVEYEIAGASEHSGAYVAENILLDKPRDQTSRWSGAIAPANSRQWIRLRLKHLTVLKSITFGKYYKGHPCNMKEFKVFVGLSENTMTEILHSNLKNDSLPETFALKFISQAGMPFPTRFVEIVPLSAHGQSFNTSIWHVSLAGIIDDSYVEQVRLRHQEYREIITLRQVLKHLRQRRFLTPVTQILARSGVQLEHPLVTALHDAFVLHGNWGAAESLMRDCAAAGLLRGFRHASPAHARWARVRALDADGDAPCRRGGHAMCADPETRTVYLFGGWDGQRSLDDFWAYDPRADAWRLLSPATSREPGGPTPRACHKMVFDAKDGAIYVLGRLGDGDVVETQRNSVPAGAGGAPPQPDAEAARNRAAALASTAAPFAGAWPTQCSEFYRYQTRGPDAGKWERLTADRSQPPSGPPLISDHQMVIDSEKQMIYVSGGRVIDAVGESIKLSGMYSYDIGTGKWKVLGASDKSAGQPTIAPRWGHSMVLDSTSQTLFIFAGQHSDRDGYLADMYAFHIPTNTVTELFSNFTSAGGPDPSFTQRAVIDPDKHEIYILCGLTRKRPRVEPVLDADASYWIYRYDRPELPGKWSKILPLEAPGGAAEVECPQPRYAHQAVYDATTGAVYLHGGNAGIGGDEDEELPEGEQDAGEAGRAAKPVEGGERRLDDFWRLEIVRPTDEEIVRRALYEIRQQQFREMCEDGPPIKALTFLQTRVAAVVNHADPEEAKVFRALLSAHLLAAPARPVLSPAPGSRASTPSSAPTAQAERADSPPPRKRSRPSSPALGAAEEDALGLVSVVRFDADPVEVGEGGGGSAPSPERYRQRTQMFERLLVFVDEGAKQPDANLVDMLSTDGFVV